MRGDEGSDRLYGDNHRKDVFWLQDLDATGDQLYKFKSGQDKLRIDGSDFGIGGSLDGSELVNDSNGHDATEAKAQLIYDQASSSLWLDADGTGGQAGIRIASFNKGAPGSLSTGDFDVV
jgi:Ca2+-binding RTX toxin-like protein